MDIDESTVDDDLLGWGVLQDQSFRRWGRHHRVYVVVEEPSRSSRGWVQDRLPVVVHAPVRVLWWHF